MFGQREVSEFYGSLDTRDLEEELIGHKIVEVDEHNSKIVLDNGTELFIGDADCAPCAWFVANLKKGNLTDNAITAITCDYKDEEEFSFHVLAANTEVVAVEITGDVGTGYYLSSVQMRAYYKKP